MFRGEYFLIDYIDKIGNFGCDALETVFQLEGHSDMYNADTATLQKLSATVKTRRSMGRISGTKIIYDFVFVPNDGFLNSNTPLLNDCELKLSFDRSKADLSFLKLGEVKNDLTDKVLEISNCFAVTEYISSEAIRRRFAKIDTRPMTYVYDNCDVTLKTLPINEANIRIDNIRGGNNPAILFVGVIKTSSLNGSFQLSSTGFHQADVSKISITLNGKMVNGYPLENIGDSPVVAIQKFYDVTNRYFNVQSPDGFSFSQFRSNWLYAHKFEAETTSQGWIGVHLELSKAMTESHTLIIWSFQSCALTIDKFHQVEKIIL